MGNRSSSSNSSRFKTEKKKVQEEEPNVVKGTSKGWWCFWVCLKLDCRQYIFVKKDNRMTNFLGAFRQRKRRKRRSVEYSRNFVCGSRTEVKEHFEKKWLHLKLTFHIDVDSGKKTLLGIFVYIHMYSHTNRYPLCGNRPKRLNLLLHYYSHYHYWWLTGERRFDLRDFIRTNECTVKGWVV